MIVPGLCPCGRPAIARSRWCSKCIEAICDECNGRAQWTGEVGPVQCWKCYGTGKSNPSATELKQATDRMRSACEGAT